MKRIALAAWIIVPLLTFIGCESQLDLETAEVADDWKPQKWFETGQMPVGSIAFSPDGKTLASAHSVIEQWDIRVSRNPGVPPGRFRLWDADTGFSRVVLTIDEVNPYPFVHYSSEGDSVDFVCRDKRLRWHILEQRLEKIAGDTKELLSPDLQRSARSDTDGQVVILNALSGEIITDIKIEDTQLSPLQYSGNGRILVLLDHSSDQKKLHAYDLKSKKLLGSFPANSCWFTLSYHGTRIAVKNKVGGPIVDIYDTFNGTLIQSVHAGKDDIHAVALSPDGRLVAVGTEIRAQSNGALTMIFDVDEGQLIKTIDEGRILNEENGAWGVTALAFSPDGTTLATGNSNGDILFYTVQDSSAK